MCVETPQPAIYPLFPFITENIQLPIIHEPYVWDVFIEKIKKLSE